MDAIRSIALILLLSATCVGAAATSDEDKFRSAYAAYQEHMAANDTQRALAAARTAYAAGAKVFGKDNPNTANLASNYAGLLNDTGAFKKARRTLRGKLAILERHHGERAVALVPMLVELGRAHLDGKSPFAAIEHFNRASALAANHENPVYPAQRNFDIAKELVSRGHSAHSEPFMQRAHEGFAKTLQPQDMRLGLAAYQMAMWSASRGQHERAIDYLKQSLIAFAANDGTMNDLERAVRQRLVAAHESLGERDAATEHCLAVGAAQARSLPPALLYGTRAVFPPKAMKEKRSGEVALNFTVDAEGFVESPSVERSTDGIFDDAALEMIRQYRYAPRFEAGKPVATRDVKLTARFELEETRRARLQPNFELPPIPGFHQPRPYDPSECDPNDPTQSAGCDAMFGRSNK